MPSPARSVGLCLVAACCLSCGAILVGSSSGSSGSGGVATPLAAPRILVRPPDSVAGQVPGIAFLEVCAKVANAIKHSEKPAEVVVIQPSATDAGADYLRVVLNALDPVPMVSISLDAAAGARRLAVGVKEQLVGPVHVLGLAADEEAVARREFEAMRGAAVQIKRLDGAWTPLASGGGAGAAAATGGRAVGDHGASSPARRSKVIAVLGNMPLDATTITVDTLARVRQAVAHALEVPVETVSVGSRHPTVDGGIAGVSDTVVFTGGKTAGHISEAMQMALVAGAMGLPLGSIALEERARSTQENALFVAQMLREQIRKGLVQEGSLAVSVVSKQDHLDWALPIFRQVGQEQGLTCFGSAAAVPATVDPQAVILQMTRFLERGDVSEPAKRMARLRRDNLLRGVRGID